MAEICRLGLLYFETLVMFNISIHHGNSICIKDSQVKQIQFIEFIDDLNIQA